MNEVWIIIVNKRKKILLILVIIVIIIIFTSLIFYEKENKAHVNKADNIELLFANNYISYILDENNMSFNIFGVRKVENEETKVPITEMITDVSFNNENIKITNFNLDEGLINNGYQLFNFIVDIEVSGSDIEKADQFVVHFNSGKVNNYDIGDVTLQNTLGNKKQDITYENEYLIGYPIPSLDINITNNNKDNITLDKISDLNRELNYEFYNDIKLKKQEKYNIVIASFEQEEEYDFYTVTPILQYSKNDHEYSHIMPGVIYGILIPDEDKIKKITELP